MESFAKSPSPPHASKSSRAASNRRSKEHPVNTSSPSSHVCTTDSSPPSSELKFRVSIGHNGAYSAHASTQSNGSRDGCDESKSFKRAPGCEKFKSMQLLRERSDDRERVLDTERENSARSFVSKRGRTDDHHTGPHSSDKKSKLAVKEEKDSDAMSAAGRKHARFDKKDGRDAENRFAKGSSCLQAEPGALHREDLQEAKNMSKSSAMRDPAAQMDVDRASPKEKKAASVSRLPLKKAYKTLRALNEVGNSREGPVRNSEHGSSSGGESTGARKRASPSKHCLDDGVHNGSPAERGTSIHDFPIKFSHISKKARSHRERRSHDKVGNRGGSQDNSEGKPEEANKVEESHSSKAEEDRDVRVEGEDGAGVSSEGANTKEEEGSSKIKGKLESREGQVGSDGNVAVEGDSKDRPASSEGAKSASNRNSSGLEGIDHADNPVEMLASIAIEERSSCEMERRGDLDTVHSGKDGKKRDRVCDLKEEKVVQDAIGEQDRKTCAEDISADGVLVEMHEPLQGGSMLNFLDKGPVGKDDHANQISAHKEVGNSKQMTLSLFAKGAEAEGVKLKELTRKQDSEKEKFPERAQYYQAGSAQNEKGNVGNRGDDHSSPRDGEKSFKLESFQLSLALPGTSNAHIVSHDLNPKTLMGPTRSLQAPSDSAHTQTHTQNFSQDPNISQSNGFTRSFSQSLHNPSCSFDCASLDNQELSCGGSKQWSEGNTDFSQRSRQTVSANEQYGYASLSQDRSKHRPGAPLKQWNSQNGSRHGFPSASGSNRVCESNAIAQRNRTSEEKFQVSSKNLQDPEATARQGVQHREFSGRSSHQDGAALQLSAARGTRSEPLVPHHPASPPRRSSNDAKIEDARGDRDAYGAEIGLLEIVTEPVASMAQKMQELPDSVLEGLKGLAKDLIGSFAKRDEFLTLQSIIKSRSDLTEHTLLHAQQTQLEILVAFKTGLQVFVQAGAKPLTYKVLTEIFLQTRCRNTDCQQSLPVDGCECKICTEKKGFCHDCMCVVCTKFDSDNLTCRWVGCDVCMHWCHTDCGLRMSYITSAQNSQGAAGSTEMQYRCVACGHPSELFGCVKQVFQKFADRWSAETLTKELDCVRRIFHGSEDALGKQLCRKVEEMLQKLEKGVETAEIRRSILQYFNDASANQGTTAGKQPVGAKTNELTNGRTMAAHQEAATQLEGNRLSADKALAMLQSYKQELHADKIKKIAELEAGKARKRAEIESMVRMKQAEANMLQLRADEAHHEARGLQKIIIVKQEKIEGEYVCKYAKLKLNEAEEKRRRRVMELQELERAHHDYERMKSKIEAQIKDLAMKMEKANWQYVKLDMK